MSFCIILNFGRANAMRMKMTMAITTTASTITQLMEALVCETMMMPPMARMGEYSTMRRSMTSTVWICVMSLVPRVMSDAAENDWISASENDTTRANRRSRSFAAMPAAVREAMSPTSTEATTMSAVTPSILAPTLTR